MHTHTHTLTQTDSHYLMIGLLQYLVNRGLVLGDIGQLQPNRQNTIN